MSFTHDRAMVFNRRRRGSDFTDGSLRSRSLMRRGLYIGEGFNPAGPLVVIVFFTRIRTSVRCFGADVTNGVSSTLGLLMLSGLDTPFELHSSFVLRMAGRAGTTRLSSAFLHELVLSRRA